MKNEINVDNKLMRQLNSIRSSNLQLYLNLKKNIDAVFQKSLMEEAEQVMFTGKPGDYSLHQVSAGSLELFAQYFGLTSEGCDRCVFYRKKTGSYAAAFFLDGKGYIVNRVHLFDESCIEDVLYTFLGCLVSRSDDLPEPDQEWGWEWLIEEGNDVFCFFLFCHHQIPGKLFCGQLQLPHGGLQGQIDIFGRIWI